MMNPGPFLQLVRNSTALSPEELKSIRDLAMEFPYSQVLHLLIARGSRDQKASDEQACLHRAAVYATDRAVLKKVMTAAVSPRIESEIPEAAKDSPTTTHKPQVVTVVTLKEVVASQPKVEKVTSKEPIPLTTASPSANPLEGDALREDLKSELNRLHHLMHAFEASYEQLKHEVPPPTAPAEVPAKSSKKPSSKSTPSDGPGETPILEEIKSSKRKPKLVSPKVAEQSEIIDHFIKVAPTLPRTKPAEPAADLSVESVNYGDNIVSETLVEILLKQGKKAKAIEMLKKLIWKFPQKKAYFAAQIEALKS
jgi:hypothetical protein